MSSATIRVRSFLVLAAALLLTGDVLSGKPPCTIIKGECRARTDYEDDNSVNLEVSCVCKYRRDVSKNLTALDPILCPLIPQTSDLSWLNRTILRIDNCDVVEETFSVRILEVLRRSHNFSINVQNSSTLRLYSDKQSVEPLADVEQRVITAHFISSHINGLGPGWFTASNDVHLNIQNCILDVISHEFIGNYYPDAKVAINIENTEITTVHSYAFKLSRNGSLSVKGGKILQLESDAITGGKVVSFEAVKMTNIQKSSVNIYGLQTFKMDSCLVGKIDADAIVQIRTLRDKESSLSPKHYAGEVSIRFNKFVVANKEAFASLCREEKLSFQDNYFRDVGSAPVLKSKHCSFERDWWKSVFNNGFFCNKCQKLFGEELDEQVCALYETGWCLCDEISHPDSWKNFSIVDEMGDKVPCRITMREYINKHCLEDSRAEKYISYCNTYSDKVPELSGRSWTSAFSCGMKLSFMVHHYLVAGLVLVVVNVLD